MTPVITLILIIIVVAGGYLLGYYLAKDEDGE